MFGIKKEKIYVNENYKKADEDICIKKCSKIIKTK